MHLESASPPCCQLLEPYECQLCCFSTSYLVKFSKHSKLCMTAFSNYASKIAQDACCQCLQDYECGHCNFTTAFHVSMSNHYKKSHSSETSTKQFIDVEGLIIAKEENRSYKPFSKYYQCDKCPYISYNAEHQKRHFSMKHMPDSEVLWYECDQCDYKIKREKYLKIHKHTKHDVALCDNNMKSHQCDECNYKTPYKAHIRLHKRLTHTAERHIDWFKCEQCLFRTKQKSNLKFHVLSKHTSPDRIALVPCELCSFKTKTKYYIKKHMAIMHPTETEPEWLCDKCCYKSYRKKNLQAHYKRKHMPKNDEVRMFRCNQCTSFSSLYKNALQRHIKQRHQPEKPIKWFECEKCNYRSNQRSILQRHTKTTHERKIE